MNLHKCVSPFIHLNKRLDSHFDIKQICNEITCHSCLFQSCDSWLQGWLLIHIFRRRPVVEVLWYRQQQPRQSASPPQGNGHWQPMSERDLRRKKQLFLLCTLKINRPSEYTFFYYLYWGRQYIGGFACFSPSTKISLWLASLTKRYNTP